jgi:hypothetical protein
VLVARERRGGDGLTLVWQCTCGWAAARTVSRELSFKQSRELSALSARGESPLPRSTPFPASKTGTKGEEG